MKQKKAGKITLALTLISLGTIMLFRETINLSEILKIYLPFVLVFLGLEILISKLYYEKNGYEVKVDVLSLILVISIVLTIGGFLVAVRGLDNGFNIEIPNADIVNQMKYNKSSQIESEMEIGSAENFILNTDYSEVEILKSDDEAIRIEGLIEYRYNDDSKSDLNLEDFLDVEESQNEVSVSYKKRDVESGNEVGVEKISYRVYIPDNVNSAGLVLSYSDLIIEDISLSSLDIKANYSDIKADSIKSSIDIDANYGNIEWDNLIGNFKAKANYTDLTLESVEGTVDTDLNYGEVNVANVSGRLISKLNYSELKLTNAAPLSEGVKISGNFSDVSLDLSSEQEGRFNLSAKPGNIDLGKFERLGEFQTTESSAVGSMGNTDTSIEIDLRMGDIDFE